VTRGGSSVTVGWTNGRTEGSKKVRYGRVGKGNPMTKMKLEIKRGEYVPVVLYRGGKKRKGKQKILVWRTKG